MSKARDLGSSINSTAAGKNLIINGGFDFWQRTGTPETAVYSGAGSYVADRWTPHQFQSSQISRTSIASGSGPSSRYALRVGTTTLAQEGGGSRVVVAQKVESINTYPLRGHRVTLSFWIRFSNSNFTSISNSTNSNYANFGYSVSYNTTTTDAATGSTAQDVFTTFTSISNTNSSGSLPTTWTKLTLSSTVPLNANNILLRFGFDSLGSSTSAGQYWYEISDVQLEKGSSATSFSLSGGDFAGELEKCQRYFEKSYNYDVPIQSNTTQGISQGTDQGVSATATNGIEIQYKVLKRATPTITTYRRDGSATNPSYWQCYVGTTGNYFPVLVDLGSRSNRSFLPYFTSASGLTLNGAHVVNGHWTASAEI
jgi:hypothetical protein